MDNLSITDPQMVSILALCKQEVPGFEIRFKDESKLMKLISPFAGIFNKTFMTEYTTTLGTAVYVPTEQWLLKDQPGNVGVLAHELVHLKERARRGTTAYTLSYIFPQILALLSPLAMLAPLSACFLLSLCFLICLAPIPSVGRRNIELNGYTMSMAVGYWRTGVISDADIDWAAAQFTGPAYYFMWPWEEDVLHELRLRAIKIRTGQVLADHVFQKVYEIVK